MLNTNGASIHSNVYYTTRKDSIQPFPLSRKKYDSARLCGEKKGHDHHLYRDLIAD